ncbi:hypothetical protein [Sediminivirga luteola]|uniref:NERD domain-containing protein n=1 Tax=Sediminivirga luteola TaxID=1774748 RepID=A0A8J2XMQ4_9MICO|nr:hypothetical protein [Sediminivirga luteola]MCI2265408.1 hypothetical protein [Sediminivirga luteola]GGA28843.1 hypothetical protein GCM10011333_34350 [Sediminivirga luteola]
MSNHAPDVPQALRQLAGRRPVFHSEHDFKFALAQTLQEKYPEVDMRLERPFRADGLRQHVDILIYGPHGVTVLELKYPTRKWSGTVGTEEFQLAEHSAWDLARLGFVRDIYRLEKFAEYFTTRDTAYQASAVLLTNVPALWEPPRNKTTHDAQFRIHEDARLKGTLRWGTAGAWHSGNETKLSGDYVMRWENYSTLPGSRADAPAQLRWVAATVA